MWLRIAEKSAQIAGLLALLAGTAIAGSLTVTVKDPRAALVANASVDVVPETGGTAWTKSTGPDGRAVFADLPAGTWLVSVAKDGFARWEGNAKLGNRPVELTAALKLGAVSTSMRVSAARSPLANSDPNYQALRHNKLTKVYRVSNLTIHRDLGIFTFRSGSFSFLPPVLGRVTTGVFVGDGHFQLKPQTDLAEEHLRRMSGSAAVDEDFTAMVVYFSDATFDEIKQRSELADAAPDAQEQALERVRDTIRKRLFDNSPGFPLSFLQRVLNADDILNYDAEYWPNSTIMSPLVRFALFCMAAVMRICAFSSTGAHHCPA